MKTEQPVARLSAHQSPPALMHAVEMMVSGRKTRGTLLHGTKLRMEAWLAATELYVSVQGDIKLRELQEACGVSHKTAWRMRSTLRDLDLYLTEKF